MMDRYIEHEIMDVCKKYGIGITPFSPLAQGLLTEEKLGKVSQLESNLAASGFEIPADALEEIEKILDFHRFERHVG